MPYGVPDTVWNQMPANARNNIISQNSPTQSVNTANPVPTAKGPDVSGLTGLRDYGTNKGVYMDWSKDTGPTANGIPISTTGLVSSGGKYYGTLDQLNNLFKPYEAPTYTDPFKDKLSAALDKYLNYDPNAPYNVTTNPEYAPLKAQYESEGNTAYNNTIGSLAAMTGGRPSTAAVGAATGARDSFLKDFESNVVPSLINNEMNRRQNIMTDLYNQVQALQGMSNAEYGKYRDTVGDWQNNRNFNYTAAKDKQDYNYQVSKDTRDFNYQVGRDKVLDDQWMKNFNADERQRMIQNALDSRQISVSEANAALDRSKFDYEKSSDTDYKTQYAKMMASANPAQWLEDNKANMQPDTYVKLQSMVKPNSATSATVDDYATTINSLYVTKADPANDMPASVDTAGIKAYLDRLIKAGVDDSIIDSLAARYGIQAGSVK